jgi:predicted NUDIX family phosphoesterase
MSQQTQQSATIQAPHDEHILVVQRSILLPEHDTWQGLKTDNIDEIMQRITANQEFIPRSVAETDERYKQIIPYAIFRHNGRYFLMQRQSTASEQRLKSKYLLGIGGHVRQEDMEESSIISWAMREFHEEISYSGTLTATPVGILNDDSNEVGRVHMGLVLFLDGDIDQISVKSELQQGFLATFDECSMHEPNMEAWSRIIMNFLRTQAA